MDDADFGSGLSLVDQPKLAAREEMSHEQDA
jgi:hypothetical protein